VHICVYMSVSQVNPGITELIMTFDLLRNFLFDSDEVKVQCQRWWSLVCSDHTREALVLAAIKG